MNTGQRPSWDTAPTSTSSGYHNYIRQPLIFITRGPSRSLGPYTAPPSNDWPTRVDRVDHRTKIHLVDITPATHICGLLLCTQAWMDVDLPKRSVEITFFKFLYSQVLIIIIWGWAVRVLSRSMVDQLVLFLSFSLSLITYMRTAPLYGWMDRQPHQSSHHPSTDGSTVFGKFRAKNNNDDNNIIPQIKNIIRKN